MKILIVEDEQDLRETIRTSLLKEKFVVETAADYFSALDKINDYDYDCILLDIMLPGGSGLDLLRELKQLHRSDSVLIISAKDSLDDKVDGLELGADDYIVKPFETKEVVARIKAVLRRTRQNQGEAVKEVKYDKLSINLTNYELKVNGVQVDTPPKEMELIYHLASNPNRVFTRDQLLDEVWGFDYYGDSRTVDVHVKRLREKLEGVSDKWALKTVWGVGYKFEVKE